MANDGAVVPDDAVRRGGSDVRLAEAIVDEATGRVKRIERVMVRDADVPAAVG